MKIGTIGAGQIAGTLTHRLTELGHEVYVANSPSEADEHRARSLGPLLGTKRK